MEHKLKQFVTAMQHELDANAYKGHWQQFTDESEILAEIYYHFVKYEKAKARNDRPAMLEHCADCANLYMMLANANGLLT